MKPTKREKAFNNQRDLRASVRRVASRVAFWAVAVVMPLLVAGYFLTGVADRPQAATLASGDAGTTVILEQKPDETWRVTYALSAPTRRLDLGPAFGGYHERAWTVETPGLELVAQTTGASARTVLRARDGDPAFKEATVIVTLAPLKAPRQYEPFIPLGENGVLLYTGHFQPWLSPERRLDATFTVRPSRRRFVTAFGETKPAFERWRSPFGHPAFLYVGPRPPVSGPRVKGVFDRSTPRWVANETEAFADDALRILERAFGSPAAATPNIFVAFDETGPEGLLSFAGDALPGQFRIVLRGGAWAQPSDQARTLLRLHTAHEAAHLWQEGARPRAYNVPNWIHEGGASLVATEVMKRLGLWSVADIQAEMARAKGRCAKSLDGRSLAAADRFNVRDAIYECGVVMNWLAARRDRRGAAAFWADFVALSRTRGGYDADLFYEAAAETAGQDLADGLKRFAERNFATGEQALSALDQLERL